VYATLARAVLDETGRERAAADLRRLRSRHPRASRDALAERLVRATALRCGAASALMTGPATFFGAMPFGADLAYQTVALNRLVLALAILYGEAPSTRVRARGTAASLTAGLASEALRQGLVRLLRRLLPRRAAARGCIGGLAGAALGYAAAVAIGRLARDAFRNARRLGIPVRMRR